jgi:hypothetical protein
VEEPLERFVGPDGCAEDYAEQVFRIEKNNSAERVHRKGGFEIPRSFSRAYLAAKSLFCGASDIALGRCNRFEAVGLGVLPTRFAIAFLAGFEAGPDDARRGDDIALAILICIGNYEPFRMILLT